VKNGWKQGILTFSRECNSQTPGRVRYAITFVAVLPSRRLYCMLCTRAGLQVLQNKQRRESQHNNIYKMVGCYSSSDKHHSQVSGKRMIDTWGGRPADKVCQRPAGWGVHTTGRKYEGTNATPGKNTYKLAPKMSCQWHVKVRLKNFEQSPSDHRGRKKHAKHEQWHV
jgi:hypothetical protein